MPATLSGIHYFEHHAGHESARPPLILLHGAGGNHLSWPPQVRRLDGETVHALDLPGHGRSGGLGRQSIDGYAADVLGFMDELGIEKAVMGGISMGSAIGLTLALDHPARTAGLVLCGSGARLRVAPAILETAGRPEAFESAVDLVNANFFSDSAPARLLELSREHMMQVPPPVLLGDFLACNAFDVSARLAEIHVPTLILCGVADKMTPVKYSAFLHDRIAGSRLEIVPEAGHLVMSEQPAKVAGLIGEFLREPAGR